jgi:hypothetical protein
MTKRVRAIVIFGIVMVLVIGGILYINAKGSWLKNDEIYFLPTQGQIHGEPGDEVPVDFLCFADTDNAMLNNPDNKLFVRTDNNNLAVVDYTVEAGTKYKGMRLYAIYLSLEADQEGTQTITQVVLEDEKGNIQEFDIGEVDICVEKPSTKPLLEISQHTGSASLGETYRFTLKNTAQQTCSITGIEFGKLTAFVEKLSVYQNGAKVNSDEEVVLHKGDELSVEAKFNTTAGKDVYYVSPKVLYTAKNDSLNSKTKYSYSLPHGTLGLPVVKAKVKEIYEAYFQN